MKNRWNKGLIIGLAVVGLSATGQAEETRKQEQKEQNCVCKSPAQSAENTTEKHENKDAKKEDTAVTLPRSKSSRGL